MGAHEVEFAHAVAGQEFGGQEVKHRGLTEATASLGGCAVFCLRADSLDQAEVPAQDVSVGVAHREDARVLRAQGLEQAEVVLLGVGAEAVALGGLLHDGVVLVDNGLGVGSVLMEGHALSLALLQAGADRALARLGHGSQDRLFALAGGVDNDGAIVRDGLQRHAQVGVLVDSVQAYEGN